MRTPEQVARDVDAREFDSPFTVSPDGTVSDAPELFAPFVWHDPEGDVSVDGSGWVPLTGLTGQYGYRGAVMHPSEYVGTGIARTLLDLAAEGPATFVLTAVNVMPTEDDPEPEPAGWAILQREGE